MFLNNNYPSSFFDKILASFQSSNKFSRNISFENCFCIPYLGKESHHFANRLSALIKNKYNLEISPIYKAFKIVNYFQLKFKTPVALAQVSSINLVFVRYEQDIHRYVFQTFDH